MGEAISGIRDRVLLATKASPAHFRREAFLRAADDSLTRLKTDYLVPVIGGRSLLGQAEHEADVFLRFDRLTIQRRRIVFPLAHRRHGGLHERFWPAQRLQTPHLAICPDHGMQFHRTLNASLSRFRRIDRFDEIRELADLQVATPLRGLACGRRHRNHASRSNRHRIGRAYRCFWQS